MGAVPVLLMVTLFGMLSAQPYQGVCISQIADMQRLSDARLPASNDLDDGFQERKAPAFQACGHDVAVCLVADITVVGATSVSEITSTANANARRLQQTDDSSPVAIPELVSGPAGRVLNAARNSRVITVRKPDNSGVAGSGFSFPSVPPSLAEPAQTFAQNVDRAGRPINPAASALGATNGTTLPSTTAASPPSFPVPPFTGSTSANTTAATSTRAAPPVSTRDTPTRATNWGQFPLPTTAPAATASNPSAFGANSGPAASGLRSAGAPTTGTSPLLPTDTFGRTPSGLTTATAGRTAQSAYSTVPQSTTNSGTPGFVHVPTTDSIFSRNQTANPNAATSFGVGSNTSRPAREATTANNLNSMRSTSSGQAVAGVPVGQPPIGRFGANPSATFSQPSTAAYPAAASGAPSGFSSSRPDARLSAAQVAAGAWSVDAFGQPVDRTGQRIATAPRMNHGQRLNQQDQATGAPGFGGSFTNQTATHMTNVRPHAGAGNTAIRSDTNMQNAGPSRFSHSTSNGKPNQTGGATLASATGSIPSITETQVIETESVTTQPLFNGLLLISIVANIYLIFWLKNLRLQYHEMVAAKRMASSNASTS
ncbi:MAG: hypothetical protein CMM05_08980 [Rhodopirellula sp.]|nr:hypothetical protein [Rhodopirellula sp.]